MSKVYLITGTSTGFGRALAETALERGDKVVLTARKPEQVAELAQAYEENAIAVRLDVTNAQDRLAAVQATIEHFGRIDILVNNAGQGSLGAIEGFSSEQIRKQFEDPPLRLMLGKDAYGLWEQKRTAERQEFEDWKEIGVNTAYEDAVVTAIGG